jgi:hypothetical protein
MAPLPDDAYGSGCGAALACATSVFTSFAFDAVLVTSISGVDATSVTMLKSFQGVELELLVRGRGDRVAGHVLEVQRVAIGRRVGDVGRRDGGGRTRLVLHDDALAHLDAQALAQRAGQHVGDAAGREADDDRDGLAGIAAVWAEAIGAISAAPATRPPA